MELFEIEIAELALALKAKEVNGYVNYKEFIDDAFWFTSCDPSALLMLIPFFKPSFSFDFHAFSLFTCNGAISRQSLSKRQSQVQALSFWSTLSVVPLKIACSWLGISYVYAISVGSRLLILQAPKTTGLWDDYQGCVSTKFKFWQQQERTSYDLHLRSQIVLMVKMNVSTTFGWE